MLDEPALITRIGSCMRLTSRGWAGNQPSFAPDEEQTDVPGKAAREVEHPRGQVKAARLQIAIPAQMLIGGLECSGLPKQPRLRKSPASSRNTGSSEFRSCATIASSELSAVPICFAPLQRSTRRSTARGTPPNGRGWAARSFVRSIPALVTTKLRWPPARRAADRRGGWPDRDRFSRADRRFRASQYRASGGGAPVGRRETPASRQRSHRPSHRRRKLALDPATMPARRPHMARKN